MLSIRIKKESNSDGEDNEQLPSEQSQAPYLHNFGFKSEGGDSKDVKKELIAFAGLPRILQIQPLPEELAEGVIEEVNLVDKASTSSINFRMYNLSMT
jgi:hypothetical protein